MSGSIATVNPTGGNFIARAWLSTVYRKGDVMQTEPQEVPPDKPGQPTEPPQESPPGNPRPEVPPPMHDPGEPKQPQELPGYVPDELPVRAPDGPRTPNPATDNNMASLLASIPGGAATRRVATQASQSIQLRNQGVAMSGKDRPEYLMNIARVILSGMRNKFPKIENRFRRPPYSGPMTIS